MKQYIIPPLPCMTRGSDTTATAQPAFTFSGIRAVHSEVGRLVRF